MHHEHDGGAPYSRMMEDGTDAFCRGAGVAMLNGWQAAASSTTSCVLFLFEGATVDTRVKYALAVIGAFCLAFANESIRYLRDRLARDYFSWSHILCTGTAWRKDVVVACALAVQMIFAYALILVVILYEYVFLIAIVLGLSVGHLITLRMARNRCLKTPVAAAAISTPEHSRKSFEDVEMSASSVDFSDQGSSSYYASSGHCYAHSIPTPVSLSIPSPRRQFTRTPTVAATPPTCPC